MSEKRRFKEFVKAIFPSAHSIYRAWAHRFYWWKRRHIVRETRDNYAKVIKEVQVRHSEGRKIKVLFLFPESSKWKCQSLYDALKASPDFDPLVALTCMDIDVLVSRDERAKRYRDRQSFCEERGLNYVEAYSVAEDRTLGLEIFKPDIVFYPMPWNITECQRPEVVSHFALTCYIPYYIVCHEAAYMDACMPVHIYGYRYFTTSETWCEFFRKNTLGIPRAGELIGLGHPMLDCYADAAKEFDRSDLVIYAPHFSILDVNERYSTFLENGKTILDYAKRHPDISWCFKPHPSLRYTLEKEAGWSREEINVYYGEWEKIGLVCYTGDYPELFKHSRAMITDCSSFLMEYSAVNRPLIHLIRKDSLYQVARPCNRLFNSFYKVCDNKELEQTLKNIIEDYKDPHAAEREVAIKELNLWHVRCADNIVKYLKELVA